MKIIKESPEHHFLTTLEKLKQDAGGWVGIHFSLSRKTEHSATLENPEHIKGKLFKSAKEAETLAGQIAEQASSIASARIYLFTDNDVVFMARPESEAQRQEIKALFQEFAKLAGKSLARYSDLATDIYQYQKMADARLLGSRRIKAYEALADTNRVRSISLRRQRREMTDKVVLIVEDDRFTASYAANILNKEYDLVLAKTGEEAIVSYIEHAPDMVLLDIHLPGLNGHETLEAIRKADKQAHVVMLSVDTVKENIVRATKNGAAGFLKKPFSKERLLVVVQQSPFIKGKTTVPG